MIVVKLCCMKNTNVLFAINSLCHLGIKSYCTSISPSVNHKKLTHPYKRIHPWRSKDEFFEDLLKNIIYNKDGLVALNKPYGIPTFSVQHNNDQTTYRQTGYLANSVNYSLSDSLPFLAKRLGYPELIITQAPEKYNSGVTLLVQNAKIRERVLRSREVAKCKKICPMTYWIVTTKLPREISGEKYVGITLKMIRNVKKPVIVHSWSTAALKRREVVPIRAEFQVLSNSTGNLASLMELKIATHKWHAIRLFAATELYSPILGDNVHGARLQNIMNTWVVVNPFSETVERNPTLQKDLTDLLKIQRCTQEIVPAHIHLKQVLLPMFLNKEDLRIEAPLPHYFAWTCKRLEFKLEKLCDNVTSEHNL